MYLIVQEAREWAGCFRLVRNNAARLAKVRQATGFDGEAKSFTHLRYIAGRGDGRVAHDGGDTHLHGFACL